MPDRYGDHGDHDAGDDRKAIQQARAIAAVRAIGECHLCDDDGYIGSQVCDHIDHAEIAKRGMAIVRQTMGWKS